MIARGAGDFFQPKRDIGLRPQIEFHVGMDREGVEALLADAPPLTVGSHEPFIDGEIGLFADGTGDCVEPSFYFLLRESHHNRDQLSFVRHTSGEYNGRGNGIATTPPCRPEYLTAIMVELY